MGTVKGFRLINKQWLDDAWEGWSGDQGDGVAVGRAMGCAAVLPSVVGRRTTRLTPDPS